MAHIAKAKMAAYPLMTPQERLLTWKKVRGIWKDKRPDPVLELEEMRTEWDRKLNH